MKYFALEEILLSVLYSGIYGLICGVMYEVIRFTAVAFKDVFLIFPRAILIANKPTLMVAKSLVPKNGKMIIRDKTLAVADWVFSILFGIGFILLVYATVDGVFRWYLPIISLVLFFVCYQIVSKSIGNIAQKTFYFVYPLFLFILGGLFYPPVQVCKCINKNILKPQRAKITLHFYKKKSKRIKRYKNMVFVKEMEKMSEFVK